MPNEEVPGTDEVTPPSDAAVTDPFADPDDPEVLKKKLAESEAKVKNLDKRYRDVQSFADKSRVEAERIKSVIDKHGLSVNGDTLAPKQIDPSAEEITRDKFASIAQSDPVGAIDKLVEDRVRRVVAEQTHRQRNDALLEKQLEDKAFAESLPGFLEKKGAVANLIAKKGLHVGSDTPFTDAIKLLDDPSLSEAVRERMGIGTAAKDADKRSAAVARGGAATSTGSPDGYSTERLKSMSWEQVQKLAQQETDRQNALR